MYYMTDTRDRHPRLFCPGRASILVLEKDLRNAAPVINQMSKYGIEARFGVSLDEVMVELSVRLHHYDALFIDFKSVDAPAAKLIPWLRTTRPEMSIVAILDPNVPGDLTELASVHLFLPRPYTVEKMLHALRLLHRVTYLPEQPSIREEAAQLAAAAY